MRVLAATVPSTVMDDEADRTHDDVAATCTEAAVDAATAPVAEMAGTRSFGRAVKAVETSTT